MNPLHTIAPCCFKVHFIFIFAFFLDFPSDLFPSDVPTKTVFPLILYPVYRAPLIYFNDLCYWTKSYKHRPSNYALFSGLILFPFP